LGEQQLDRRRERGRDHRPAGDGFIEPLRFEGGAPPVRRGPWWFSAEGDDDPPAGLSQTLVFGRARRIQTLSGEQT
jgi:hypothetical protein